MPKKIPQIRKTQQTEKKVDPEIARAKSRAEKSDVVSNKEKALAGLTDKIRDEIKAYDDDVAEYNKRFESARKRAETIGAYLMDMKEIVGHGHFDDFVKQHEEEFGVKFRRLKDFLSYAEKLHRMPDMKAKVADKSMRQALPLLQKAYKDERTKKATTLQQLFYDWRQNRFEDGRILKEVKQNFPAETYRLWCEKRRITVEEAERYITAADIFQKLDPEKEPLPYDLLPHLPPDMEPAKNEPEEEEREEDEPEEDAE